MLNTIITSSLNFLAWQIKLINMNYSNLRYFLNFNKNSCHYHSSNLLMLKVITISIITLNSVIYSSLAYCTQLWNLHNSFTILMSFRFQHFHHVHTHKKFHSLLTIRIIRQFRQNWHIRHFFTNDPIFTINIS